MVIVYARTSYVSRYFPALGTVLTFPVVYHFTGLPNSLEVGRVDHYNMTNDTSTTSSNGGVIIQRRPSVIKRAPRQNDGNVEDEQTIDVVGIDGTERDEKKIEESEMKCAQDEVESKEAMTGRRETNDGRRRTKRKRVELLENGEDEDWKLSENKRHVCNECGMRFKKPSALIIHLRTHSGERPYACTLCHKRFSISGNLRRHMFTHTGEKPYKCRACGRAFNNPSHLARHSKKIHI